MKKLLLISALASLNVHADADILNIGSFDKSNAKVIIGLSSMHFRAKDRRFLNEVNPSIGLELWDIQAVYVSKNSWSKGSVYITYSPDYKINNYISIASNIGIATGYKCTNIATKNEYRLHNDRLCSKSGVIFLPALTVEFRPLANAFALNVSITPSVAMLSASYDF